MASERELVTASESEWAPASESEWAKVPASGKAWATVSVMGSASGKDSASSAVTSLLACQDLSKITKLVRPPPARSPPLSGVQEGIATDVIGPAEFRCGKHATPTYSS